MTRCFCGQPLHYTSAAAQAEVEALIKRLGSLIRVKQMSTGRAFLVPRHYIALHGIKEQELDQLGFVEVEE